MDQLTYTSIYQMTNLYLEMTERRSFTVVNANAVHVFMIDLATAIEKGNQETLEPFDDSVRQFYWHLIRRRSDVDYYLNNIYSYNYEYLPKDKSKVIRRYISFILADILDEKLN